MEPLKLREILETLYHKINNKSSIRNDPIKFPHRYKNEEDVLLVGFISAIYSYGKVDLFTPILERIFTPLGDTPAQSLKKMTSQDIAEISTNNYYRFYTSKDLSILLLTLRNILRKNSLIDFFEDSLNQNEIISSILSLRNNFFYEMMNIGSVKITNGISFMFPDPNSGSALKRIFMFLRWMVRRDEIDFGIIKSIKPKNLIIPLDTHIANIARLLDMTRRKNNDLKCAIEITHFLGKVEPNDPVKYDFALAHIGISKGCRHRYVEDICSDCILYTVCNHKI
ncbi:MAG: TIGR02757 family protein [Deltaproteobacteria bacterium]|nr:TIGR02757 family protein [Deltaproteobacteria bacterium]